MKLLYNNGSNHSVSFSIAEIPIVVSEDKKIEEGRLYSCFENDKGTTYLATYSENGVYEHFYIKNLGKEIDSYSNNAMMFSSTIRKSEFTTKLDKLLGGIKTKYKSEADLIERMSDIYGNFDYEFIPRRENYQDKRVALGNERIFSDFQGDGMQRALGILSTLELSADSAIFIEEIEMFQHPKALRKLAVHMIDLAKKNRIQLFITTHSHVAFVGFALDGKNSFDDEEEQKKLFRSYIVSNKDGIVGANVEYDSSKIADELYHLNN
ncbi:MAG: AAA family ATPase [Candidatus Methanoperedens sp.]|nr:AAA family ATPase [Candidatus Methanoperedens sp.]